MPVVTGTVLDLLSASMASRGVELVFQPNEPMLQVATTTPGRIHPTAEVKVKPDASGKWSAALTATTVMLSDCFYKLRIDWADGSGTAKDFPDWQIRVPVTGGHIGEFVVIGPPQGGWGGSLPNLSLVMMALPVDSQGIKPPPGLQRGQPWWLTDPDDPQNLNGKNTGEIRQGV